MWVFECSVDIAVDSECRLGVCFLFYDDAVLTAIRVAAAWIGLHSIHKSNGMSTMFFNNAWLGQQKMHCGFGSDGRRVIWRWFVSAAVIPLIGRRVSSSHTARWFPSPAGIRQCIQLIYCEQHIHTHLDAWCCQFEYMLYEAEHVSSNVLNSQSTLILFLYAHLFHLGSHGFSRRALCYCIQFTYKYNRSLMHDTSFCCCFINGYVCILP